MDNTSPSIRPRCPQCLRALRTCICKWVHPLATQTEVLILQHPLEVHQAKGSGRLLHLNLVASRLHIGETFEPEVLHHLLHSSIDGHPRQAVLLYPDTSSMPATHFATNIAANDMTLVVLDATWKKSLKMLHANVPLQSLPRLLLDKVPASQYKIRQAHRPDQLSTFEATSLALVQVEHNQTYGIALSNTFNSFIEEQMTYIPAR